MEFFYPFFVAFCIVFFSELGDKTQLLVLSFSTKNKAKNILLGVAIGTFFSHGVAILFGSKVASFSNDTFQLYLKFFTYISFILFGILGFLPKKETTSSSCSCSCFNKYGILKSCSSIRLNCIFIIAICIIIGELGDKTFLASLGLGLQYPSYKLSLIAGSICGMVGSNLLAIFFGKFLGSHLNQKFVELLSNVIFIIFGVIGLVCLLVSLK